MLNVVKKYQNHDSSLRVKYSFKFLNLISWVTFIENNIENTQKVSIGGN